MASFRTGCEAVGNHAPVPTKLSDAIAESKRRSCRPVRPGARVRQVAAKSWLPVGSGEKGSWEEDNESGHRSDDGGSRRSIYRPQSLVEGRVLP